MRTATCGTPPGSTPCTGSIWVNRNENIGGRPVTSLSPTNLVRLVLMGKSEETTGCIVGGDVSNVTFQGFGWNGTAWTENNVDRGLSYFSHGTPETITNINGFSVKTGLGMTSGLLLTTGGGRNVEGPNNESGSLDGGNNLSDTDLALLVPGYNITTGSKLEFDFVPLQSSISFDYIFASVEYPEYVAGCGMGDFNDVFGFFISGPGIPGGKQNIAKLPTTTTSSDVVSIKNVNWGCSISNNNYSPTNFPGCPTNCSTTNPKNPQYYVPNYECSGWPSSDCTYQGKYMEYDGRTVMLTAKATVIPGETYHLKLAVANVGDSGYGSGVFLRASSLDLGSGLKNIGGGGMEMANIFEGCANNVLEINFPPSADNTSVTLAFSGNALNDIKQLSGSNFPNPHTVTVLPNESTLSIPYIVKSPVTQNDGNLRIIATITRGDCSETDTVDLKVYSKLTNPQITANPACTGQGSISVTVTGGSSAKRISINNGGTWVPINQGFSGLSAGDYTLWITDYISCDTIKQTVTIYGNPVLSNATTVIPAICNGGTAQYTATCDLAGTKFKWTRAAITGITPTTGAGNNASINETLTNTTTSPITVTYTYTLTVGTCNNDQTVTVVVYPNLTQPNPLGTTIPYNTTHTFNLGVAVGGAGTISYLWQESNDGITWSSAATPNNTQNYTTPPLACSKYYRRQATGENCGGTINSEPALITVSNIVTLYANPAGTGSYSGNGTYNCGEQVTLTATPAYCHNFVNWTYGNGTVASTNNPFKFNIDKDTTLTANFVKRNYSITLHRNPTSGGTVSGAGTGIECGEFVTVSANTDPCYTFSGWTDKNNTTVSTDENFTFELVSDTILTANFVIKKFSISLSANPPLGNQVTGAGTGIDCGTSKTVTAIADDCYNFVNWTSNGVEVSTNTSFTFVLDKDTNLVANFAVKMFSVNLSVASFPPNGGTVSGPATVPCEEYATIEAVPNSCFTFKNWTVGSVVVSSNSTYSFQVTGHRDFVANFEQKKFSVTVKTNTPTVPGNTVTGTTTGVLCGTTVNITATEDECYTFVNWTNPNGSVVSTSLNHSFPLNGDSTYTANFTIKTFGVNVGASPTGGGTAAVSGSSTNIPCNNSVTVTATADPCYNFVNWTEGGSQVSTNSNYTFNIKGNRNLVANFTIKTYNINVSMNPTTGGGTISGGGTYNCGDNVIVTAIPDECYTFDGWTENGVPLGGTPHPSGSHYLFIAGANRNLVANFKQKTYNLSVQKNTPNNNVVSGDNLIAPCGELSTIVAIPDVFHTFFHWTDKNNVVVSTDAVTQIDVQSDTTLIAVFLPKTYNIAVSPNTPAGGATTGGGANMAYNTECTVTASCNPPLYKFSHWEDYGTKVEDAGTTYTFPVTGDRDLVAVFKKETVIIKVITEPDTCGMAYQSAYKVELDSLCYVWATPSFCHHFTKWTLLDMVTTLTVKDTLWFEPQTYYTNIIDGVLTFVAHFTPNTYHVEVEPFPYYGGDVYINNILGGGDGDFTCNTEIEIKAVANHPKYRFVEWVEVLGTDSNHVSYDPIYTFVVREDHKFVARFELIPYQITLIPNPGGAGTVEGGGPFPYGSEITVHAEPYDEWTFYNWTENDVPQSSNPDFDFTVTRDRTLYANFIPRTFTVKVVESPLGVGGIVTGNGTNIDYGTIWDITATALHPYVFSHWEENGTPYDWPANHTIAVNRDFDLTAVFVLKEYEITLESNPPLGGTTTGEGTFVHGTVISVEAFDNYCHTFSHWTENGGLVASNSLFTFTVTGPRHLVAHFTPEMHNINLTATPAGGGTLSGGGPQACMSEITVSAIPDECYTFDGWFENDQPVWGLPDYTFTVDGARDLVAHFTQKLFTITTSDNPTGCSILLGDEYNVPCGEERTVIATPKVGYIFDCWKKEGVVVSTDSIYTFTVMEDNNLVAHFHYAEYEITLQRKPYEGGLAITGGTYPHGFELTVHALPNPEYVFVKWTEGEDDDEQVVSLMADYTFFVTHPRTLTAHFDTARFTVTTAAFPTGTGTTTPLSTTDILCGTLHTVEAVANAHFVFQYWTIDGVWESDSAVYTFPVTKSCHLVAHFKPETLHIILKKSPTNGGTVEFVCDGCDGYNIPYADPRTIKATPFFNYEFVNWTREDGSVFSNNATHSFAVLKSDTLTANFILKNYTITVSADPGGGGQVWVTPQPTVLYGEWVTVHAQPNNGYHFLYWTEFGSTVIVSEDLDFEFQVFASMHLVAHFELDMFTVKLKAMPTYGGQVWGDPSGENFPWGTQYTAHQQANPNFTFVKWTYEDGTFITTFHSYTFNIFQSCTLIAHFKTVSFPITLAASPEEGGTVEGEGEYDFGTTVTITATPNECYTFDGWYEDDVLVGSEPQYTFVMDGPHHFVAHFIQKLFNLTTDVSPAGSGTVTVNGTENEIPCEEERIVTAIPAMGYVFLYWTFNGTNMGTTNPYPFDVMDNYDIVAHFEYQTHKIDLGKTPTIGGNVYGAGTYPHGHELTVQATANPGFTFLYWTENDEIVQDAGAIYPFIVDRYRYLIAHFDSATYTVTTIPYQPDTGTTSPSDTSGLKYGASLTVTATPADNYQFVYWMENDIPIYPVNPVYKFTVTKNRDLVALFTPQKFNVTVSPNNAAWGDANVVGNGFNIPYAEPVTVEAVEYDNYVFVNWTYENGEVASEENPYTFAVSRTIHLTANFMPMGFNVTVAATAGGNASGGGTNIPYLATTTVVATANTGYVFKGWYEDGLPLGINTTPWPFIVTRDRNLLAVFECENFNIFVTPIPATGGNAWESKIDIPYGTKDTVWAEPFEHWTFVDWRENGSPVWQLEEYPFMVTQSRYLTAHFTPLLYPITLLSAAPDVILTGGGAYAYGTEITVSATPTGCYDFWKWTENGIDTCFTASYTFTVEGPRTLVAHFTQKTVSITTAPSPPQGGTTSGDAQDVQCNTLHTVTAVPNQGYIFKKWTKENDTTTLATTPIYEFLVSDSCKYIAHFEYVTYNIVLYADPVDGGTATTSGTYPLGKEIDVFAKPFPEYKFVKWTENDEEVSKNAKYIFTVEGHRTLTAHFAPATLDIILSAEPPDGGDVFGGGEDFEYGQIITINAIPKDNYKFAGWYEKDIKVHPYAEWTIPVTRTRHLVAHFTLKTFNILLTANPTDGGTTWEDSYNIPYGTLLTVKAIPDSFYYFVSWTEAGTLVSVDAEYTFTVKGDRNLVANFGAETVPVTLLSSPPNAGILTGGGNIPIGKTITVEATANPCYDFLYWMKNGVIVTHETQYTLKVEEACTLIAYFKVKYINITTSASPPEYGTADGEYLNIPCGDEVTVIATPKEGYYFVNWTINETVVATEETFTFTSEGSCHLVANFAKNTYDITLIAIPPELGSVWGGGPKTYDEEITVHAVPKPGQSLINWTENDVEVSTDPDYTFTVTQARTLVANFDKTVYHINVEVNDTLYGTACCSGVYNINEIVEVNAFAKRGYRFLHWTIGDSVVCQLNSYEFPATQSVTLTAHFYGLEFDEYAATLWDNTFMLNLNKLAAEEYEVTGCKWFKNGKLLTNTNTIDEYSYSAGPKATDLLELAPTFYTFEVLLKNGSVMFSTKKMLTNYAVNHAPPKVNLLIYPNPAFAGNTFTVENVTPNTPVYVYNQMGICIEITMATANKTTISLNQPAGVYLIKNQNKEGKITIVK